MVDLDPGRLFKGSQGCFEVLSLGLGPHGEDVHFAARKLTCLCTFQEAAGFRRGRRLLRGRLPSCLDLLGRGHDLFGRRRFCRFGCWLAGHERDRKHTHNRHH